MAVRLWKDVAEFEQATAENIRRWYAENMPERDPERVRESAQQCQNDLDRLVARTDGCQAAVNGWAVFMRPCLQRATTGQFCRNHARAAGMDIPLRRVIRHCPTCQCPGVRQG